MAKSTKQTYDWDGKPLTIETAGNGKTRFWIYGDGNIDPIVEKSFKTSEMAVEFAKGMFPDAEIKVA